MLVQFTVIPVGHEDQAFDITERRFSTPDEAVNFWQQTYPQAEYDIDDIRWDDRQVTRAYIKDMYHTGKDVELPIRPGMSYDEYAKCLKKVYYRLNGRWPDAWLEAWMYDDRGNKRNMSEVWSIEHTFRESAAYQERARC